MAIYVALLPWTGQVWLRTGDEPHYLVAADSLVRDGDLDLRNNYNPSVYLDWYPSPNLNPQVKIRADGAQFLIHTYGLSILIAPAYWLAGARGVAYFMAGLGALLAGQVYLLGYQVTQNWRASALGALVVALAPPLVWYVYLVYPEVAGALCVTVAARVLIAWEDPTPRPTSPILPTPAPTAEQVRVQDRGMGVPPRDGADLSRHTGRLGAVIQKLRDSHLLGDFPSTNRAPQDSPLPDLAYARSREGRLGPQQAAAFSPLPDHAYARSREGGLGPQLILGLSLAALPWLSARFIPAALTLAALGVWRVGRGVQLNAPATWRRLLAAWPSLLLLALSLAGLALFNALLYGHAEPTASYAVDIAPGPVSWGMLLQVTRGVLGWLLDHQRGLLIAGPIYLVALIGLGQWLRQRAWAAVVVGLPFAAALASTALVGGFWVGVEPAARYLVYVLPPLGAALAYAWAHRRGPWLAGLTVVTLAISLWTAVQVFRDPLLAQTHDLIGEQAQPLVPFLPALGRPTYLAPGAAGDLAVPISEPPGQTALWRVPKGQAGSAFQQPALTDFSFGWYVLQFELGARGAPADAPVARVFLQAGDQTALVDTILYGRDFSPEGQPRTFTFPVYNQVYNQWAQPAGLWIFTTGRAELILSQINLPPQNFHSLILPVIWLVGLALLGLLVGSRFRAAAAAPAFPRWLGGWGLSLAGVVLVLGVGAWSLRPIPRQYPIIEMDNFIGSRVPEAAAAGGEALSTAGDEDTPGVLAVTRPESWPAGIYRWRLSLKARNTPGDGSPLATLTIRAPRQAIMGFPTDIGAGLVPADGRFHTVEVEFNNPVHQALAFELDASGASPLESQGFEVSPLP